MSKPTRLTAEAYRTKYLADQGQPNLKRLHRHQRMLGGQPRQRDEFAEMVASMTNSQRTRWARAKYPGLRKCDTEALAPFVILRLVELRRLNRAIGGQAAA